MTPDIRSRLHGISGILATPFDREDRLDMPRLKPVIDRAVDAGVHILVSNGNTGEFYSMSTAEAQHHVTESAAMIGGRVPLLAGIGRALPDAVALAKTSAEAGAAGMMIHQPPDPFVAPRGVVDYVRRVHEASGGLDMVIYLRNDAIGTANIVALCEQPGVVGVKWATPNPMRMAEAKAAAPDHITWVGGLAEVWAPPLYAVGARGFTSGLINIWPEHSVAIHTALEAGEYARARALIAQMAPFEDIRAQEMNGTNVSGVKAALALTGVDCGAPRPPAAWPLTKDQHAVLLDFLRAQGLLRVGAA